MNYKFITEKLDGVIALYDELDALDDDILGHKSRYREVYDKICTMLDKANEQLAALNFYCEAKTSEDKELVRILKVKKFISALKSSIKYLEKAKRRYTVIANINTEHSIKNITILERLIAPITNLFTLINISLLRNSQGKAGKKYHHQERGVKKVRGAKDKTEPAMLTLQRKYS
ncbi:hypothetical protein FACS1894140_4750 [Spirochaetia bacterium]|nr:hypothetical protein FACS1894140_4750 [Spirochaetia bacterium]